MTRWRVAVLPFLKKAMLRLYVAANVAMYLLALIYVERMRK